jgi:hypothetical protein
MNDTVQLILDMIDENEIDRDLVIYNSNLSNEIVWDIAQGKASVENVLLELCEAVHAGCDFSCPVYCLMTVKEISDLRHECPCFKSGIKMKKFIASRRPDIKSLTK